MTTQPPMDIMQFIQNVLHEDLSMYQETALRLLYGLPLTPEQFAIAQQCLDTPEVPPHGEYAEGTFICGRRSGKTERLAANVTVYEAVFGGHERYLSPGEIGHCVLLAQDKRAARVAYRYVLAKLQGAPQLKQLITAVRSEEIQLANRITILILPCSWRAPRGFSIPVCALDEFGFFRVEGINVDKEICDSIRPAQATFPRAKFMKCSTPYAKTGELYRDYATRHQRLELLCFHAESKQMNPTLSDTFLESERLRDPDFYDREYLALFSDSIQSAFTREAVEACICPGRFELPPDEKRRYLGCVDPSGGGPDEFSLSIAHLEKRAIVQDCIRGWRAKQPQSVVDECTRLLKAYGISMVVGDRYSGTWVRSAFGERGIRYHVSEHTASEAFLELLPVVNQGSIELLDDRMQTAQLIALERRTGRSGKDSLGHPPGGHDDRANSLALGAAYLAQAARRKKRPSAW